MTKLLSRTAGLTEERRSLKVAQAQPEIREDAEGVKRFAGHGAVFDSRAAIGNPLTWGWYEEIAPGAFTKTLAEGDARMLIDHNSYYVVSRVSAGTLVLDQDEVGLAVDSALDTDLSYVSDLIANLRNKNITGMSIGFWVVKADWNEETVETSDGQQATVEVRRIKEIKLAETSPVTFPAFEDTDAGLRTLIPAMRQRGDLAAIERRARYRPELLELLPELCDGDELSRVARRMGYELHPLARPEGQPIPDQLAEPAAGTDPTAQDFREMYADLRHLLNDLRGAQPPQQPETDPAGEPDTTTRSEGTTTDDGGEAEPAASTPRNAPSRSDRMGALQARFGLPSTPVT